MSAARAEGVQATFCARRSTAAGKYTTTNSGTAGERGNDMTNTMDNVNTASTTATAAATTATATTNEPEITAAMLAEMPDGYSVQKVELYQIAEADGTKRPIYGYFAIYKIGAEYGMKRVDGAKGLASVKPYHAKKVYIPSEIDVKGVLTERAEQIAAKAYYANRIETAKKALKSNDGTRRAMAADKLAELYYMITDGAAKDVYSAQPLDAYAEKIATVIAGGVCDYVAHTVETYTADGEKVVSAEIAAGDRAFNVSELAAALISPSQSAKDCESLCAKFARWICNGWTENSVIPAVKAGVKPADVDKLRKAMFAGLRATGGVMQWTMAAQKTAFVQIARFGTLLVAENGADYARMIKAAGKADAEAKALKKAERAAEKRAEKSDAVAAEVAEPEKVKSNATKNNKQQKAA